MLTPLFVSANVWFFMQRLVRRFALHDESVRGESYPPAMTSARWVLNLVWPLLFLQSALADPAQIEHIINDSPVLNVRYGGWSVKGTLVPGIYSLAPPSGKFAPAFYQESSGYIGSLQGWQEATSTGMRALPTETVRNLRHRIVTSLKWERGIKTVYGRGQASALLFSAFDCPNCRRFEQRLAREGNALNATLYLFPQTLQANDAQRAQMVSQIWCAPDPRKAWDRLQHDKAPTSKPIKNCDLTNQASTELSDMLGVRGVPALVTRQGTVLYGFVDASFAALSRALAH